MRPRLVIFAKAPLIGFAKTRLYPRLGAVEALRRYRAMTARIIRQTRDPRWDSVLAVAPDRWSAAALNCWPADIPRLAQGQGDLGVRQARIFSNSMTIVIGTDAPDVHVRDITDATKALRRNEAVIGPATDGGYWLLGLKHAAPPGLFNDVRWSSEHTLEDILKRLKVSCVRLRRLTDIDL